MFDYVWRLKYARSQALADDSRFERWVQMENIHISSSGYLHLIAIDDQISKRIKQISMAFGMFLGIIISIFSSFASFTINDPLTGQTVIPNDNLPPLIIYSSIMVVICQVATSIFLTLLRLYQFPSLPFLRALLCKCIINDINQ